MKRVKFDHDLGLRHKSGMTASEFIERYCKVFRPYATATQDDSLNEFEKLISHVLNMLCYHQERSKMLGLSLDPRKDIRAIEDALEELNGAKLKLAGTLYNARGELPDYGDLPDLSLGETL